MEKEAVVKLSGIRSALLNAVLYMDEHQDDADLCLILAQMELAKERLFMAVENSIESGGDEVPHATNL
jgi:hypothetical protein